MVEYERFEVPVEGGHIACGRWGSGGRVVLASHGITANHLSWQRVGELLAEADGGLNLVAVDHRGRAGSASTPGTYGMVAHGDDLIAVLDHLGVESAVIAGHSMGAFVSAAAAEHHPDRVDALLFVDGGVPFDMDIPPDADVEAIVQSVIGPALDRLDQRWPDEDAYVDFFRAHPAFQPPNEWTDTVEAYVRYDCVPLDGEVGSSAQKEAVLVDGGAAIVDPESASSVERISQPTTMLWCPRGILDQTPGLYDPSYLESATAALAHVTLIEAPDTNHYTVVTADHGARAVVAAIIAAGQPG